MQNRTRVFYPQTETVPAKTGLDVGTEFSNYRVIEHIGRGGMADVWSARDRRLNRTVAIKTVARGLSQDMTPLQLFEREAQTIAALEHPHILPIYEFGDYAGQLYIVMRYVAGGSLEDRVDEGALPLEDAIRLARQIAQALEYAHSNRVVHLDIKPSNVLMDSNDQPYLADFGLATMLGPEGRAANPGSGTLLYMAPEQLTSDVLDHRADIYSFTVLLFHMLTGQLPFDATTPLALKQIQYHELLPSLDLVRSNIPPALTDVLRLGTSADASQRPNSVADLMREFEQALRTSAVVAAELGEIATPLSDAILEDAITQPSSSPEAQAKREAQDIYNRARRAWAHGQGRFLLGVTHFTLINDYYVAAEAHGLELDEAGMQMLLRGAIEYGHEVEYWWSRLNDESRRWVALHAVRSENAPARVRALQLLATVADADLPAIPRQVAQALQTEKDEAALLAALRTLEARARTGRSRVPTYKPSKRTTTEVVAMLTEQLQLRPPSVWQDVIFSAEIDTLLARVALSSPHPAVAELAARIIGRIYSLTAVRVIAEQQRRGARGALRALALVRDEAPSLPPDVSQQARLYAWLANTWRRLSDNPLQLVRRHLLATVFAFLAIGLNTYITYRSEAIFSPSRWGTTISIGLTCGALIGFTTLLADEFPSRLRGFFPWWARLIMAVALGIAAGTLVWAAYTYLYLEFVPTAEVLFAGTGLALGLIAAGTFKLRGWAAFLLTALATYIPLYVTLYNAYQTGSAAIIYYDFIGESWVSGVPNQAFILGIPLALLIALGGHFQALVEDARGIMKAG